MKSLIFLVIGLFYFTNNYCQDIYIGFNDSIKSKILNENRNLIVRLPEDYNETDKSYPVLYRLDGDKYLAIMTIGVVSRLAYREEVIPDMIVVLIENTNRGRDMWPKKNKAKLGAEDFQEFIETELIPYIDNKYRTTNQRILCGQSASTVFTLYYFLTKPSTFDSYIAISAGFPGSEEYFMDLAKKMVNNPPDKITTIFIGNEVINDPDGKWSHISNFVDLIKPINNIACKYQTYINETHVPFPSFYHGLKFIYENKTNNNKI